jgi:predicted transposase/invertase (TIGR01784 family)
MSKTKAKKGDEEIQSVYIDPLTDFGFKKIFLNKELLIAFLNDIVGTDIKEVQYQPTEGLGIVKEERITVFDLLCTTKKGEQFIVEMQLRKQTYFANRALFYASHAIRKQAPRGKKWKFDLKPVYIVSILDFIIFTEEEAKDVVIERVYLYRERGKKRFSEKLEMIFIELPKFKKTAKKLQSNTETWLWLLKHTYELKDCPPEITDEIFKQFLETAEIKHLTTKEMISYRRSLKRSYQMRDADICARREGRVEGELIGRMEKSKLFATKLLMRNIPIDDIVDLTELSPEQVQELIKQLPKA